MIKAIIFNKTMLIDTLVVLIMVRKKSLSFRFWKLYQYRENALSYLLHYSYLKTAKVIKLTARNKIFS